MATGAPPISKYPPGPKGRPIIGVFPEFRRDPARFLLDSARQYGDIVYFKIGKQDIVLINRPDLIQDVLVNHPGRFMKSRILQRAKQMIGEGLLTSEGQFHLRQRRLVQPAFHRDRLIGYGTAMTECALRAQSRWREGDTRDIAEEMMHITLAIVARTLFSADIEGETREIGEAMTAVLNTFNTMVLPFADLLQKLPLPAQRRALRARARLDETIYRFIAERRASGEDRGDLLSMLLLAQDELGDGSGMTDRQVRDEAMTLFLAGHETTANALTWTWYLLSQHPEVETRMRAEIAEVLGGRTPGFDDLPRLRYTEMVFAESMRLYPPAWAIARLALKEHGIDSYVVEPGWIVAMSPFAMHRKPEYYPDPERFDPERWTAERKESRPRYAYFPFGGGPRICIGERFAWMEGMMVLATVAQRWRFQLAPGARVQHHAQITLRTRHGLPMVLESAMK